MKNTIFFNGIAAVLVALLPGAAQALTFPCEVTDVCRIAGSNVACDAASGGWSGSWNFAWDGGAFSVESPRGTFQGALETEPEAWPIIVTVTADDSPMPGWAVLYETSQLMIAMADEPRGGTAPLELLSLQGTCGAPE